MTNLRKNKLIELTPEIWGVVEYLGEIKEVITKALYNMKNIIGEII